MFLKERIQSTTLAISAIIAIASPCSAYAFFDMLSSAIPIASCISNPKLPFMSDDAPTGKAEQGKTQCENPASKKIDSAEMDKNFKAKCEDAEVNLAASDSEDTSAIVYTLAFGACLSECIYPYTGGTVCTLGTLAGISADFAGAANVAAKAEKSVGFLMQGAITGGVDVMAGGSMGNTFSKLFSGDDATAKLKDAKAVTEAQEKQQSEDRKSACISTALNAVMAIGRACKAKEFNTASIKSYEEANNLHKEETLSTIAAAASSDGSEKSGLRGGQQMEPGNPRSVAEKTKKATPEDKLKSLEATAAFGPVAQAFQERTGKSAAEVLNRMAAGQHPLMAAAETIGGQEAIQAAAQLAANGRELQEVFKEEMHSVESKSTMPSFESTGRRPMAKGGSDMPDIAGMMAAFMPKNPQTQEKDPQGATATALRAPAAKLSSEGFHTSERSIFEIVGSRYQVVAKRVLESEPMGRVPAAQQPASMVPKNLYLGR